MADRKFIKWAIILLTVFSTGNVWAYSAETTHKAVTAEALKVFEYYYPDQDFTETEENLIIKGSADEDKGNRPLNHFYDPVYQRGFRGLLSSKLWAQSLKAQAGYFNGLLTDYFSSPNDYSWERAIYDYVYDDKNRGLEALGHILHLIQDATVPDHTRNDAHPFFSSYENYTKQFKVDNLLLADSLISQKLSPTTYNNLDDYFDNLAVFSNGNFFSDDTILKDKYKNPQIKEIKKQRLSNGIEYEFGYFNKGKLIFIDKKFDSNGLLNKFYLLKDPDSLVLSDYWSNLSEQAILNSAGVIKLFFSEVEKEKQNKELFNKNKSLVAKAFDGLNVKVNNLLVSVKLAVNPQVSEPLLESENIEDKTLEQKIEDAIQVKTLEQKQLEEIYQSIIKLQIALDNLKLKLADQALPSAIMSEAEEQVGETRENILTNFKVINVAQAGTTDNQNILSPLVDQVVEELEISTTTPIVINAPVISEPVGGEIFATTTLTFFGTADPSLIIFNDFSETTAIVSTSSTWEIVLSDLPQGLNVINFYARDEDNHLSNGTEISFTVDTLPPQIELRADLCDQSLADSFCLVKPASSLRFNWSMNKSGNYLYKLVSMDLDDENNLASTTLTSTEEDFFMAEVEVFLEGQSKHEYQIFAYQNGQLVATSSLSLVMHPWPIVINEIAWARADSSVDQEWIELSNLTTHSISLDNFYLTDANNTWRIELNGWLNSKGYYLIERGSDDSIIDLSADLIADFGVVGESPWSTENVGLKLWRRFDGEEILIDETPVWNMTGIDNFATKERGWEHQPTNDLNNWHDNDSSSIYSNQKGETVLGTPREINKASIPVLF